MHIKTVYVIFVLISKYLWLKDYSQSLLPAVYSAILSTRNIYRTNFNFSTKIIHEEIWIFNHFNVNPRNTDTYFKLGLRILSLNFIELKYIHIYI